MKIKNCKLLAVIFLLACYQLLATTTVFADNSQTQNLSVSAIVGPQIPDFQFNLTEQNNATSIHQGENHTYVLTYGAKPSAQIPTNNVITVYFGDDLAPNNQHIFDYVYGSASDGYGGAKPVIDLVNKTITWNISSLPAGTTNQKVYFNVFTNSYQGSAFTITLTAQMSNQYVTMPDQTLTQNYQYQTPTPGPTATPTPVPTTAPSPTPTPEIPAYNVSFNGITGANATVQVTTGSPSKISILYGTTPTNLGQTVWTNSFQTVSTLTIPDLQPDTTYYFRIKITGEDGMYYITEIFTFKTATQALSALPLTGTAVISANGTVLLSESFVQPITPGFALLTSNFPYEVTVSLPQNATYKSLEAIVQQHGQFIDTLEMAQQQPGIYTAHMPQLGNGPYSIFIKTLDEAGSLVTQKIAELKVIAPLSVTDKQSGAGIENARIFLSYFDQGSNSYKPMYAGMYAIQTNPGYTDGNGMYAINLPPGRYRVQASALLYDTATVDFTLGKNEGENFPRITIKKDPTNIIALLTVIKDYLLDILTSAFVALQTIATSSRVFHVVEVSSTGFLILLTYLFFLLKSHTSIKNLPLLFFLFIDVLLQKHKGKYLFGKVTDASGAPLSLVRIEVEDAQSKAILRHTTTNKTGKFYFVNKFTEPVNLLFMKEGYQPTSRSLPANGFPEEGLQIILQTGEPHHPSALILLGRGLRDILGMLFETALVLSIILEVAFFFFYGFARTAPFLILSIINILLWIFYLKQTKIKETLS